MYICSCTSCLFERVGNLCADHEILWFSDVRPQLEILLKTAVFPRLSLSKEDRMLWQKDPTSYVRSNLDMESIGTTTTWQSAVVSILSEGERASRNGSTVVDISIPSPSFKPLSWSLSRSPLF